MQEFIVVYVTVGSAGEGERLARTLVEERLAACVNRIKSIQSVYRWQGKVEASAEELLIIKTKKELFRRLEKRVRALHSYTVPEIIALPVIAGSTPYLRWLKEQVAGTNASDSPRATSPITTTAHPGWRPTQAITLRMNSIVGRAGYAAAKSTRAPRRTHVRRPPTPKVPEDVSAATLAADIS